MQEKVFFYIYFICSTVPDLHRIRGYMYSSGYNARVDTYSTVFLLYVMNVRLLCILYMFLLNNGVFVKKITCFESHLSNYYLTSLLIH